MQQIQCASTKFKLYEKMYDKYVHGFARGQLSLVTYSTLILYYIYKVQVSLIHNEIRPQLGHNIEYYSHYHYHYVSIVHNITRRRGQRQAGR